MNTFARKLNTSGRKVNTLTPKLNTFAEKLNTSPRPTEHIPVTPASPSPPVDPGAPTTGGVGNHRGRGSSPSPETSAQRRSTSRACRFYTLSWGRGRIGRPRPVSVRGLPRNQPQPRATVVSPTPRLRVSDLPVEAPSWPCNAYPLDVHSECTRHPLPGTSMPFSASSAISPRVAGVLSDLPQPLALRPNPPLPHPAPSRAPYPQDFANPPEKSAKTLSRQPDPYGVGLAREGSPFIPQAPIRSRNAFRGPGRLTAGARPAQYGARHRCERPNAWPLNR